MNVYFDNRWTGPHGIGRFADRLAERIAFVPLDLPGKPSQPLAPLQLACALRKKTSPALFFSPGYTAPLFAKMPFVFCIHDLAQIESPEARTSTKALFHQLITKRACHNAHSVLTVSEFSRSRILHWSGLPEGRVVTVGNGVDAAYQPDGAPFAFPQPYLLCVSNRRPHKNEPRLLAAFAQARGLDGIPLLFTGDETPEIHRSIQDLGIANRVFFVGRIPESELPALYRSALALLFPSLYEGFGLPVVEAMASGTPVLTSNTTSLPEIGGNAVLTTDPYSIDGLAHELERIVTDSELRATLRTRGLERAKLFSWESTANRVKEVLAKASSPTGK